MMHYKGFDSVVQAGKKLRLGTQSRHMDLVELTWEGGGGVGPRKKDRRRDGIKEMKYGEHIRPVGPMSTSTRVYSASPNVCLPTVTVVPYQPGNRFHLFLESIALIH
jgi:hypothetical protein